VRAVTIGLDRPRSSDGRDGIGSWRRERAGRG
jgi:hypothetical protein